jgi:hypothetical protein
MAENKGWVLKKRFQGEVRYLAITDDGILTWSSDPTEAFRFHRKLDGERFNAWRLDMADATPFYGRQEPVA